MDEKQDPKLSRVLEYLPKVKERTGKPAWEHLRFGKSDKQPSFIQCSSYKYYGEVNANGEPHGRAILNAPDGGIIIGNFDDGGAAPGTNYIIIYSNGELEVG